MTRSSAALLLALPLLAACPDAPRAADDKSSLETHASTPPAHVTRAALLFDAFPGAPLPNVRGALAFEETTVTSRDGTRRGKLDARYRIYGLTPGSAEFRLRLEPTARCGEPTPPDTHPPIMLGANPLEAFMGSSEGEVPGLEAD